MSEGPERILVTGANGHLGRQLLRRIAQQVPRPAVRALVRSERAARTLHDLPSAVRSGIEIEIVDYGDPDQLTAVAVGCDCAVHLLGILKETRANRYADAHEKPCSALAGAAAAAGLRRIVALSILGSSPDSRNPCLASKGRSEQLLLQGATPTLILRVPMVLGAGDPASQALRRQASSGRVALVRGGASLEQPIAAGDVVSAVLAGLFLDDPLDTALDLAGPESLSHRAARRARRAAAGKAGRLPQHPGSPSRACSQGSRSASLAEPLH